MNKRGFIRIVEASISVLIIAGVLIAFYSGGFGVDNIDHSEKARDILEEVSRNETLRNDVSNYDTANPTPPVIPADLMTFIGDRITDFNLDYSIAICDVNVVCGNPAGFQETSVYAGERIIGSTIGTPGSGGIPEAVCGDNVAEDGELCDGTDLRGETCENFGLSKGELGCASGCDLFDISHCVPEGGTDRSFCNDDVVEGFELCDRSNFRGETCESYGFTSGFLSCNDDCLSIDTSNCIDENLCIELVEIEEVKWDNVITSPYEIRFDYDRDEDANYAVIAVSYDPDDCNLPGDTEPPINPGGSEDWCFLDLDAGLLHPELDGTSIVNGLMQEIVKVSYGGIEFTNLGFAIADPEQGDDSAVYIFGSASGLPPPGIREVLVEFDGPLRKGAVAGIVSLKGVDAAFPARDQDPGSEIDYLALKNIDGCERANIECSDGEDNDGDGFCDLPESTCTDGSTPGDSECISDEDASETDFDTNICDFAVSVESKIGDLVLSVVSCEECDALFYPPIPAVPSWNEKVESPFTGGISRHIVGAAATVQGEDGTMIIDWDYTTPEDHVVSAMSFVPDATCGVIDSGAVCGNSDAEAGELCDRTDLRGETCENFGYSGGVLSCLDSCIFDISNCSDEGATGPDCPNDVATGPEWCDGTDFRGETCESYGFTSGFLSCNGDCSIINTDSCSGEGGSGGTPGSSIPKKVKIFIWEKKP